jgi:hypothetical protein
VEVVAVVISVIGVFFAARAARAARETVRLTREMRHDADVRRVLEALVTIQHACQEIERPWVDPEQGKLNPRVDNRALIYGQHELDRALALPGLVTDDVTALRLLERLRTEDFGTPGVVFRQDGGVWAAGIREDAQTAESLLTSRPPPKTWPRWYLRLITLPARKRAARAERKAGVDSP